MFAINPEILFTTGIVLFSFKLAKLIYEPFSIGVVDTLVLGCGTYLIYKKQWIGEEKKDDKTMQVANMLGQLTKQLNQVVNEYQERENKILKQMELERQNVAQTTSSSEEKPSNPFFIEYSEDDVSVTHLDLSKVVENNDDLSIKLPLHLELAVKTPLPESPKPNRFFDEDFESEDDANFGTNTQVHYTRHSNAQMI